MPFFSLTASHFSLPFFHLSFSLLVKRIDPVHSANALAQIREDPCTRHGIKTVRINSFRIRFPPSPEIPNYRALWRPLRPTTSILPDILKVLDIPHKSRNLGMETQPPPYLAVHMYSTITASLRSHLENVYRTSQAR